MPRVAKVDYTSDYKARFNERGSILENRDCSVIALSVVCNVPYQTAHEALKACGRKNGRGTNIVFIERALEKLGYKVAKRYHYWDFQQFISKYPRPHNTLKGVTTHHPRRFSKVWKEHFSGAYLMITRGHILAIKDATVHDWSINNALRAEQIWEVSKA